ncbi:MULTISPECIES: hypothetical protein [unclassified Pseudomonas]|uniref:hypothetical protein n=1 Tax=unclassified Pseudomonas TaxID=196821 RepID=UPI0011A17658|nr:MULTISPECIES: hypothetical protein [unclassified Pseudomonas]TWC17780.1 hypothetical protein FBY05_114163 [Pseudomonas sp. SJZ083]TWC45339.1 hypothetical protein FBY01_114163 [Pseudomonas sp. SJZ077]
MFRSVVLNATPCILALFAQLEICAAILIEIIQSLFQKVRAANLYGAQKRLFYGRLNALSDKACLVRLLPFWYALPVSLGGNFCFKTLRWAIRLTGNTTQEAK